MTTANPLHSSASVEWYTPAVYVEAARRVMGGIDLDPASCEVANRTVKAGRYFTAEDDGLAQPWSGRVWLNPPYGAGITAKWVGKAIEEASSGRCQVVLLVNATPDRRWFAGLWEWPVCFAAGRIRFIGSDGKPGPSPTHGNAFAYLGPPRRWLRFAGVFSEFGHVVLPQRPQGRLL